MRTAKVIFAVLLVLLLAAAGGFAQAKNLKAGFVYIGPIGDSGWTFAHDQGRKYAMSKLPWLTTVYVESVPEGDSSRILDRLVQEEKCDVVLTTSFGYMDDTIKAGERYPKTLFMHCSGFKNLPNVGTYFAELYQMYYLNGLMAGALTKTGKLGYVGAFPTPEVVRHLNAFALGIKAANPKARMQVRWIFSWYDPGKAKEAAEALVADGCDALAFTEDSASVVEVGQEHTKAGKPVYTFGHYSPMQKFGPDSCVSGQLVDWGVMYVKIFQDIRDKTWTPEDMWWLAKEGAAKLGGAPGVPINPKFAAALKAKKVSTKDLGTLNVYDLVLKRYDQMLKGREIFDPFTGPVTDNKGKVQIPAGRIGTKEELLGPAMSYYVDNISGDVPK
jgi:basic membrane protein A